MTLVKDGEAHLIQDHSDRYRDYSGISQWGRKVRLKSKYSMGKWEFIAREQSGVSGWKITKRKHQG